METLVVEAFSNKFGPSFLCEGVWHVADKTANPNLTCSKGDKVEVERNGKWVKSFQIVGKGTPPPSTNTPKNAQESPKTASKGDFRSPDQIMRCSALESILGSPAVSTLVHDKDESEAFQSIMNMVDKTYKYISTGSWS